MFLFVALVNSNKHAPSLMILNDDCLLYLLRFFNITELMCMRGTCIHLDTLIEKCSLKYLNFDFGSVPYQILSEHARDILKFVGPYINSLKINSRDFHHTVNFQLVLEWIFQFCEKLKSLDLINFDLNPPILHKLRLLVQHLKHLSIRSSFSIGDELGMCFESATNLEELIIHQNDQITGECITKISNLKVLSVSHCQSLKCEVFKNVLKNNKNLRKLEILSCHTLLHNELINYIVHHARHIEEISLSGFSKSSQIISNFSQIAELPNLKKLKIEMDKNIDVDLLLNRLSEKNILEELHFVNVKSNSIDLNFNFISKISNLKVLSIEESSTITEGDLKVLQKLLKLESFSIKGAKQFNEDGLLNLLIACKNMKHLNVSFTNVSLTFLQNLIQLWKEISRPKLELDVKYTRFEACKDQLQCQLKEHYNLKLIFAPL